jgi:type IV secretory pathway VirB10-like protein
MTHALNSDLEGTVTALVTEDVFDSIAGQYRVIPRGSRLFGFYDADVRGNVPRLHLAFKTLYFPNGSSLALSGMPGVDSTGMAGVSDHVNRHFWQRYGSAAVLSLITAGISLATYNDGGFYSYSPADAARYGAGQVMGQAVGEDLRQSMRIRPTLTVPEGYVFNLMITQDVMFPGPYPFTTVQVAQGGGE